MSSESPTRNFPTRIGKQSSRRILAASTLKKTSLRTFYEGIKHKPETTFGNVKADVLGDKDPKFPRVNFCSVIRGSQWKG